MELNARDTGRDSAAGMRRWGPVAAGGHDVSPSDQTEAFQRPPRRQNMPKIGAFSTAAQMPQSCIGDCWVVARWGGG